MEDYVNSNIVNVAVQVLPSSPEVEVYDMVDRAIAIIQESGVEYIVTPFETVMQGEYNTLMEIVRMVQNACYLAGADKVLCYCKIQSMRDADVFIDDKIGKYKA